MTRLVRTIYYNPAGTADSVDECHRKYKDQHFQAKEAAGASYC